MVGLLERHAAARLARGDGRRRAGLCRAFGDFGITLMVAGNIPGRTPTLPLAIYDHVQANQMPEDATGVAAVGLVVVLLLGLGRFVRLRY